MNRDEIENALSLVADADTTHEDARDWYAAYGWHLSTESAGDVCHDAVEYDWLDGSDESCVETLMSDDDELSEDEAEAIVEAARGIRDAAESICGLLDKAVEAYEAGELDECKESLLAAYSQEWGHGDAPASQSLASELLSPHRVMYRVYLAPDGCDPSFCGDFDTLEDAVAHADGNPRGLEKSLWDTARAAGHCGGHTAPEGGEEDDEPISWHGDDGYHCVVQVVFTAN